MKTKSLHEPYIGGLRFANQSHEIKDIAPMLEKTPSKYNSS
jgi:hypothetical protein